MTAQRRLSVGPRADEFHQRFGVGGNGGEIHPVDGVGVALAAIQGLHALIQEHSIEIGRLRDGVESAEQSALEQSPTPPPAK